MPFIQNISLDRCRRGDHAVSDSMMLIQITDPLTEPPKPAHSFKEIRQYCFLDLEEAGHPELDDAKITYDIAESIANDLTHALEMGYDVIVHCHAGKCRSGAVAEVGTMIGFDALDDNRTPNLMVKHYLMRVMGLYYGDWKK